MDSDGIAKTILRDREKGASQLEATYREPLYSVAFSLCHDPTEAEDLVLRTIEQVIAKIDTYEEQDSFYNWMCVILKNLYIDSRRRKTLKGTILVGGPKEMEAFVQPVDADAIVENVDAEIVRRAIEKLPPKMREVLILHYFMDMPVKQIARTLRLAHGTVLSRLHHARRVLARRLGEAAKKPAAVLALTGLVALGAMAIAVIGGGLFGDRSGSKSVIAKETHAPREVAFKWPDVKWPAAETTTRLEETPIIEEAPIIASAPAEPPLANTAEDSDTSDMDEISLSEVSFSPNQQYGEAEVSLLAKNQNGASDISFSANQQDGEATMNMQTIKTTARQAVLAAAVATTATLTAKAAATTQSFLFYGQNETSPWSDENSWKYNNGRNSGSWVTPNGLPDTNEFDVYFRSPMTVKNGSTDKTQSYNSSWNHVVTFSGAQKVGKTHHPVHVDAGSSAENPIVFTATQSDYGLTSTNTLNIAETANGYLQINSGTYNFGYVILANGSGKTGVLTMNGGTLNITDKYTRLGCGGGTGILTVKTGAVYDNTNANNKNMTLGQDANSSGTLNVQGGYVKIGGYIALNYNPSSKTSTVTVTDGGILAFNKMYMNNSGQGGSVTIDGGTLKACGSSASYFNTFLPADNGLNVFIGANGATIDTDEHDIAIGASLQNKSGYTGVATFTGGGSVTLSGAVSYTGKTFVTPGTILAVANATAKTNILKNGLVLAGLPVADQTIVTYTSAFEDDDLAKVSCSLAPTTTFKFTDETKTAIAVDTPGATINYWTGTADNDLSNDANWSSGTKPTGVAYIVCATPATLTKGTSFAATAFTFLRGSEAVTIEGDFSGITAITNNSASAVEFTGTVAFSDNVDVVQDSGAVKFTGGATGTQLARATDIHGTYTFTKTGDLTEKAGTTIKSDGVYNLPNGTFFKHNADFHIEAGGKAVVKKAKIESGYSDRKLLGNLRGEFKVTDEFYVSASGASYYTTNYMNNAGSGTFIVNKLRLTSKGTIVPADKTIVGGGGVMREGSGYVRIPDSGSREFGACADWTMYYNEIGSNTNTLYFSFYKEAGGSSTMSTVVFDTTDYYDSTIGRTITCEAPIGAATAASATNLCVTVKGKGTFVFANTYDRKEWFSGGLTVQDTATVEVKANAKPGKGAITLGAGTKLVLNATTLSNTLNLPTGEGDVATIRINGTKLSPGDYEIATVGTGATANVTLDPDSPVLAGRKGSLRVENNKLVLNVKPIGLMVIFR